MKVFAGLVAHLNDCIEFPERLAVAFAFLFVFAVAFALPAFRLPLVPDEKC